MEERKGSDGNGVEKTKHAESGGGTRRERDGWNQSLASRACVCVIGRSIYRKYCWRVRGHMSAFCTGSRLSETYIRHPPRYQRLSCPRRRIELEAGEKKADQ